MFNAGDYDSQYVPRLLTYCRKNLTDINTQSYGHWHYTHYYYAQVLYRQGGKEWEEYRNRLYDKILAEASADGSWTQGSIGPVNLTAVNLTILQLDNGTLADLPAVASRSTRTRNIEVSHHDRRIPSPRT